MQVLMEKALPLIRGRHTSLLDTVRWSSQAEQPTLHLVYASTESKAPPVLCQARQGAGSPVGIPIRVEGTHVVHLLQVDVGENQLVVTAVDDSGAVRAGEHVGGGQGAESPQDSGLGPQGHLLAVTQQACRKGAPVLGATPTELAGAG